MHSFLYLDTLGPATHVISQAFVTSELNLSVGSHCLVQLPTKCLAAPNSSLYTGSLEHLSFTGSATCSFLSRGRWRDTAGGGDPS